jgi:hypothetical protein
VKFAVFTILIGDQASLPPFSPANFGRGAGESNTRKGLLDLEHVIHDLEEMILRDHRELKITQAYRTEKKC